MNRPAQSGQPIRRGEDIRLLTGAGNFLDDNAPAGCLHAAIIRSPHAHAKFTIADHGSAEILTGADYVADGLGMLGCGDECQRRDGSPMAVPPRYPLAVDTVRFVGEPVAMALADTPQAAAAAAEAVEIDYASLPAVTDVSGSQDEAFFAQTGSAAAFEEAAKAASHLVTQALVNQRVSANTMEPRGALGMFDSALQTFTLRAGVHSPHQLRSILANEIFDLAEEKFRVITGDVGGSFGMRGATYPELILVFWAARRFGRPVKWVATRSEAMLADDHGRDMISSAALALDSDGKILGLQAKLTASLGAYLSIKGPRSPLNALSLLPSVYCIPALDLSLAGVFTNTNPTTPYRGAGGPEAAYIIERLLDKAARETGIDRVELRRRNLIRPGDMPYENGAGWSYDSGDFDAVLEKALTEADAAGFDIRRESSEASGRKRGLGICLAIEQTARPGREIAEISVAADGAVTASLGSAPQGQGHETTFRQILADALEIAPENIAIETGDSAITASGGGTFNSRSLVSGGSASVRAAESLIEKGRRVAAEMLEASVVDIEYGLGAFTIIGTDRSVTLSAVAAESGLSAAEEFATPQPTFPNGAHLCEVEIDPETGRVTVERYLAVDDVGMVINPLLLDGQIQGGVAQGIGQALMEAVRFDPATGQNLSGSFMDYAMPRADDLCDIDTEDYPVPTALNPLGAKGAGEAGTCGALPAVMCAIADALGHDDIEMPATAERVWRALRASGKN